MEDVVDLENPETFVDTYDKFFGAEVSLTDELGSKWWTEPPIVWRKIGVTIEVLNTPHCFQITNLYEVSFPNGLTEELTDNVISENILYQVDSEGHH